MGLLLKLGSLRSVWRMLDSNGSGSLSYTEFADGIERTKVRGQRAPPYGDVATELRGERLYGAFNLVVRVPDLYEKRWQSGALQNGVLRIRYRADEQEEEEVTLS